MRGIETHVRIGGGTGGGDSGTERHAGLWVAVVSIEAGGAGVVLNVLIAECAGSGVEHGCGETGTLALLHHEVIG